MSTLADTLGTKVLSVLGILSKGIEGIFSCFTYFVVSYILILQYDYLKLVYVKMYYAYMCYMMLSLNKIITKKKFTRWGNVYLILANKVDLLILGKSALGQRLKITSHKKKL